MLAEALDEETLNLDRPVCIAGPRHRRHGSYFWR
jgi:hypothetical protein